MRACTLIFLATALSVAAVAAQRDVLTQTTAKRNKADRDLSDAVETISVAVIRAGNMDRVREKMRRSVASGVVEAAKVAALKQVSPAGFVKAVKDAAVQVGLDAGLANRTANRISVAGGNAAKGIAGKALDAALRYNDADKVIKAIQNPAKEEDGDEERDNDGASERGLAVGVGVGIGLGAVLLAVGCSARWFSRRRRTRTEGGGDIESGGMGSDDAGASDSTGNGKSSGVGDSAGESADTSNEASVIDSPPSGGAVTAPTLSLPSTGFTQSNSFIVTPSPSGDGLSSAMAGSAAGGGEQNVHLTSNEASVIDLPPTGGAVTAPALPPPSTGFTQSKSVNVTPSLSGDGFSSAMASSAGGGGEQNVYLSSDEASVIDSPPTCGAVTAPALLPPSTGFKQSKSFNVTLPPSGDGLSSAMAGSAAGGGEQNVYLTSDEASVIDLPSTGSAVTAPALPPPPTGFTQSKSFNVTPSPSGDGLSSAMAGSAGGGGGQNVYLSANSPPSAKIGWEGKMQGAGLSWKSVEGGADFLPPAVGYGASGEIGLVGATPPPDGSGLKEGEKDILASTAGSADSGWTSATTPLENSGSRGAEGGSLSSTVELISYPLPDSVGTGAALVDWGYSGLTEGTDPASQPGDSSLRWGEGNVLASTGNFGDSRVTGDPVTTSPPDDGCLRGYEGNMLERSVDLSGSGETNGTGATLSPDDSSLKEGESDTLASTGDLGTSNVTWGTRATGETADSAFTR